MSNRHCHEITDVQREELFRHYWKDLDKERKKIFICENVFEDSTATMKDIANICKRKGKVIGVKNRKRETTFRYHFPVSGERLQVCQTMFVGTLCVPEKSVREVVKGSFGLLQDSTYNAALFEGEDPMIQLKQKPKEEKETSSDGESSSEEESELLDNLCDDESSDESCSEEEVFTKSVRKAAPAPESGWYRRKDKVAMKERCSRCRRKCKEITDSQRESIFDHFWNDLDRNAKDEFVRDLITVDKPNRVKMIESAFEKSGNPLDTNEISKRLSFKYHLPKGLGNEKIVVCAGMFEGTLSIGSSKIKRIVGVY